MNRRVYLALFVCLLAACSMAYADGGYDAAMAGSGSQMDAKSEMPRPHKAKKHHKKKKKAPAAETGSGSLY